MPGLGPDRAEEGRRVECAGTHLHVERLHDNTAALRPVLLQGKDQILKGH